MARYGHKEHPDAKQLAQSDLLFGRPRAEEFCWERGQQACAVATSAIGIDTTAVREAFEGLQRHLENFVAGRAA
jgi:hypothetical protein